MKRILLCLLAIYAVPILYMLAVLAVGILLEWVMHHGLKMMVWVI